MKLTSTELAEMLTKGIESATYIAAMAQVAILGRLESIEEGLGHGPAHGQESRKETTRKEKPAVQRSKGSSTSFGRSSGKSQY